MIPLGLSAAEQAAFERGLCSDHQVRVGVQVLDMDHGVVGRASDKTLSGQVDFDATQVVKRSASLEVSDPDNALGLDSGQAWVSSLYLDRMVQIHRGVWSHEFPRWVNVPLFTGPITSVRRSGDSFSITAHDKSALVVGKCSMNRAWPKGTRKTDIIRQMLQMAGERFIDIPTMPDKVTTPVVLTSQDDIWSRASELAATLGAVRLVYNGVGYATLRPRTSAVRWRFEGGTGGSLLSRPQVGFDTQATRNLVVVAGGIPAGGKRRIQSVREAPANHPLSPGKLGRGGAKRWLREDIADDAITSQKAADALAQARLDELLMAGVDLQCEALVIPHLEPHDVVEVQDGDVRVAVALEKATIPLSADGRMSIGRHVNTGRYGRRRRG